ncbi:unnamed protein product, partial [Prorocentrum cordatum]
MVESGKPFMRVLNNDQLDNKLSNSFDALPALDIAGPKPFMTRRPQPLLVALLMVARGGLTQGASIIHHGYLAWANCFDAAFPELPTSGNEEKPEDDKRMKHKSASKNQLTMLFPKRTQQSALAIANNVAEHIGTFSKKMSQPELQYDRLQHGRLKGDLKEGFVTLPLWWRVR